MKQKLTILFFLIFIFGMLVLMIVTPDQSLSKTERRKLAAFPHFSVNNVLSGSFSTDLETYLLDQFPFRENFRHVNAISNVYLFNRMVSNDIYVEQDHMFKIESELDEKQVVYATNKINEIVAKYLSGMKVYYAIVPEKNNWEKEKDVPKRNFNQLEAIVDEHLTQLNKIDIQPLLDLDCYYQSDPHWRQEKIYPIALTIAQHMGNDMMIPFENYDWITLEPFYGTYVGQSALAMKGEPLRYAVSEETKQAFVKGAEFEGTRQIYHTALFNGMDSYDVYLSGAQAFLEIELEDAPSEKELIIFRDSFGSSIAPYFVGAYKKVTLVDLRYMSSDLLHDFIDFENQDILFLYSSSVLNNGMILK